MITLLRNKVFVCDDGEGKFIIIDDGCFYVKIENDKNTATI